MNKLNPQGFEKARDFMKKKARKLDLAWFEYWFENGSVEDVLAELVAFKMKMEDLVMELNLILD